jgi:hypothetical protein
MIEQRRYVGVATASARRSLRAHRDVARQGERQYIPHRNVFQILL